METIPAGRLHDGKIWAELDVEGEDSIIVRARWHNETDVEGRVVVRREGGSRWELRLFPTGEGVETLELAPTERPILDGRPVEFEWPRASVR